MSWISSHPFSVAAHFDYSLVLTYAIPIPAAQRLLPPSLIPDTYENYAFFAAAFVATKNLRPKGFPKFLGNDFFLAGFRIFVRYNTSFGKNYRGLYILRSLTDKTHMVRAGNMFTHYNYSLIDLQQAVRSDSIALRSQMGKFDIDVNTENKQHPLPVGSPFPDWKTARRYAGPLPFTFTVDPTRKRTLIVQGMREDWEPQGVSVNHAQLDELKFYGISDAILANAFVVRDIPYYWKKGVWDSWKH
jgi:hypothetical protein